MAHFVKMSDGKYFFAPSMRYLKGLAQQHSSMTRYWAVWGAILAFLLVGFLVAEALDVPLLADPIPWLTRGGLLGAILAVALLTVDAVLPVPASLVVVAAGALYGTVTGPSSRCSAGSSWPWPGTRSVSVVGRWSPSLFRATGATERMGSCGAGG
jgi:hypothetical protein